MQDIELIKQIRKDDGQEAMAVLMDRYTKMGISFVYKMVYDMNEAKDIVQDTFIKLYENANDFNADKDNFKGWFFTVLRNASIDFLRRNNRFDSLDDFEFEDNNEIGQDIFGKEIEEQVKVALNNLPLRQKEALILNYYEDNSQIKASEIMNVSLKAYESLLSRARQNLKAMLKGIDYEY